MAYVTPRQRRNLTETGETVQTNKYLSPIQRRKTAAPKKTVLTESMFPKQTTKDIFGQIEQQTGITAQPKIERKFELLKDSYIEKSPLYNTPIIGDYLKKREYDTSVAANKVLDEKELEIFKKGLQFDRETQTLPGNITVENFKTGQNVPKDVVDNFDNIRQKVEYARKNAVQKTLDRSARQAVAVGVGDTEAQKIAEETGTASAGWLGNILGDIAGTIEGYMIPAGGGQTPLQVTNKAAQNAVEKLIASPKTPKALKSVLKNTLGKAFARGVMEDVPLTVGTDIIQGKSAKETALDVALQAPLGGAFEVGGELLGMGLKKVPGLIAKLAKKMNVSENAVDDILQSNFTKANPEQTQIIADELRNLSPKEINIATNNQPQKLDQLLLPAAKTAPNVIEQGPIPVTKNEISRLKTPAKTAKTAAKQADVRLRLNQLNEIKQRLESQKYKVPEQYTKETPKMITPAEAQKTGILKTATEQVEAPMKRIETPTKPIEASAKISELKPKKMQKVKITPQKYKISKFKKSLEEAPVIPKEIKTKLEDKDFLYEIKSNKKAVDTAYSRVNKNVDSEIQRILKDPGKSIDNDVDSVEIYAIADKLVRDGKIKEAQDFVTEVRPKVTTTAQALQALAVNDKLSPGGILITASKMLEESAPSNVVKQAKGEAKEVSKALNKINTDAMDDILEKMGLGGKSSGLGEQPVDIIQKKIDSFAEAFSEKIYGGRVQTGTKLFEIPNETRPDIKAARKISDALNLDTVFVKPQTKSAAFFNGVYHNGTIFVNANSDNAAHIVLGHEIMEKMSKDSPEIFDEFVNLFKKELDNTKIGKYKDTLAESIRKEFGREMTDAEFYREAAGDYSGEMFNNPDIIENIVKKAPNVAQKIVQTIRNIIQKLKSIVNPDYTVKQYINDTEKVQSAYLDAIEKYIGKNQTPQMKLTVEKAKAEIPKLSRMEVSKSETPKVEATKTETLKAPKAEKTPTVTGKTYVDNKTGKTYTETDLKNVKDRYIFKTASGYDDVKIGDTVTQKTLSGKTREYYVAGKNVDGVTKDAKGNVLWEKDLRHAGDYFLLPKVKGEGQSHAWTGPNFDTAIFTKPDTGFSIRRSESQRIKSPLDNLIKRTLRESGVDIGDIVRKHYTEVEAVGKTLKEKIIDQTGISGSDAQKLSDMIQTRFNELTSEKKKQILNQLYKTRTPSQRKSLSDKVIELSNMGALSDAKYADALYQKYGIPQLDEETAKSIVKQAEQIQKITNTFKRQEAVNKMMAEIQSKIHGGVAGKVRAYTLINTLLNPKTIGSRNVLGNVSQMAQTRINKYIMSAIDYAKSNLTGSDRKITFRTNRGINNVFKDFFQDIYTGARAGWEGYSPYGTISEFRTATQQFKGKHNPLTYMEKALGASLGGAGDYPFYMKAVKDTIGEMSVLRAMNEGYKGADIKIKAKEYADEVINSALKISDFAGEVLNKANRAGEKATFRDPNVVSAILKQVHDALNIAGFGKPTKKIIGKIPSREYGLGDLVVFFSQTPGSLINIGIEYSPAGILKSMYYIGKGINDSLKGTGKIETEKVVESLVKSVTGTLFYSGLGYYLTRKGAMTGKGPKDTEAKQFLDEQGKKTYSFNASAIIRWAKNGFKNDEDLKTNESDKWYTYDWFSPFSFNVKLGANLGEETQKETTLKGVLSKAWKTSLESLYSESTINNLVMPFKGYDIENSLKQTLLSSATRFVPMSSILNQIRQLTDNASRSTKNDDARIQVMNMVKNRIPGLSKTLPEVITTTGQAKEMYQGGTNNFLNVVLNPGFISKYKETSGTKLLIDLYKSTGETKQFPRKVEKSLNIYNQPVDLTQEQQADLQKYIGYSTMRTLDSLVNNKQFNNLADDKKVKAIYNALNEIGQNAEQYMADKLNIKKAKKVPEKKVPKLKVVKP